MAEVYVGTWRKYNNSDLSGAWTNLGKCAAYAEFLEKCRNAHRDEAPPNT